MKWVLTLICSLICFSNLAAIDPVFPVPPNPLPPPFSITDPTLLPVVLTNNSLLEDREVNFVVIGSTLAGQPEPVSSAFIQFDDNGVGQLVLALSGDNASNYSKRLSEFPTYPGAAPGARVCYMPNINSALAFFSLIKPLDIPVNSGNQFVEPSASNPSDPNYNIKYQTFEFVYLDTPTQISSDLTAIAYFCLPIYAYISTPDNEPNTGLYQPRPFIMSKLKEAFDLAPESEQWNGLFLRRPARGRPAREGGIIRILGTGQAMTTGPTPLFDPNYLDNAAAYGYSFIGDIWSNPDSFYRNNVLSLQIPLSAVASGEVYTGVINPDNTITFTSTPSGYTVNFDAPTTSTDNFTTTENIFEGQPLWTTFNTGIYTDDPQQLSKLFEEAVIAGLIPTTNTVSNSYFIANMSNYYTVNPNLSPQGQITGPWYDLYSKVLHGLGPIYTFSFDEPLWPDVQISSQFFTPNQTFLGLTICPVVRADSSITLTFSPLSPTTGDLVTFTAMVTGNPIVGDPTGPVIFTIDGAVQAPVELMSGVATFQTSSLSSGSHVITATYVGEPVIYRGSTATETLTISDGALLTSTTSLTSSQNPASLGDPVNLISTVTGTGSQPTGTVTFVIDGISQPPINLVNGQAILTTAALTAGIHQITSSYSGSVTYLPSPSSLLRQVILDPMKLPSITSLTSSKNPARFEDVINFTVTVTGAGPTPTGTVTFTIDGVSQTPINLVNGQAVLSTSSLSAGIHRITADYSGSPIYSVSASSEVKQVVVDPNKLSSTVSVTSSENPAVLGDTVNFTALVSGIGLGPAPTGTVTFIIDGSSQIPINLVDGQAVFSTSSLSTGTHLISVDYSGTAIYNPSTSPTLQQVISDPAALPSSTSIASSRNPALQGETINLTATVTGSAAVPTGTIIFTIDGTDQAPLNLVNGQATFSISSLTEGVHVITATYSGSVTYSASVSTTLRQVVLDPAKLPTSTSIASSRNPAQWGENVLLTATVTGGASVPKGTVTFTIDGASQLPVNLEGGQATLATSSLTTGIHLITATYSGSAIYSVSISPTLRELILDPTKLISTTSITSSQNPALLGNPVSFTAVVTGTNPGPVPTGTVTFIIDGTPQAPINLINGQAVLTTSSLTAGVHLITADYSGSGIYSASTTPNFYQIIFNLNQRNSSITISASQNPIRLGSSVTFTAEVVGEGPVPKGKVIFYINNIPQSPVTLVNGQATFTTSNLIKGLNLIQATYEGNVVYSGSISNILTELVFSPQQISTSTTLTSSVNPSFPNSPIIFTAKVQSARGNIPKGNVVFLINGSAVAEVPLVNGEATFETSTLLPGKYEITAVYKGSRVYSSSISETLIQYVAIVFPPRDVKGNQIENKFVTQTDIINIISWKAPLIGPRPIAYKIYEDSSLTHLVDSIRVSQNSSQTEFEFIQHNRKADKTYHYLIVAIDKNGNISPPVEVVIRE